VPTQFAGIGTVNWAPVFVVGIAGKELKFTRASEGKPAPLMVRRGIAVFTGPDDGEILLMVEEKPPDVLFTYPANWRVAEA
jgi:hypothetical protein